MQLCNRQLMFSIWSHSLQMTLNLLVKKHWWLFTMERRHWIPFAWLATVRKSPRALPKLNQEVFPPQVLLQNTTATESFSKYASGKAMNVTCPQSYGDGILLMESSIPQQQIFLQLPLTCWKSFIVIAQLTAAQPEKHEIKCSLACSNCHGSGCMNAIPIIADDDDDQTDPIEAFSWTLSSESKKSEENILWIGLSVLFVLSVCPRGPLCFTSPWWPLAQEKDGSVQ